MTYVVDSSVALKWVLPEIDSLKAIALRDDFRSGSHELIAPDVFPIEIAHALARAERRRIINPPDGAQKLIDCSARRRPSILTYLCWQGIRDRLGCPNRRL